VREKREGERERGWRVRRGEKGGGEKREIRGRLERERERGVRGEDGD
jgi:hypothetical protein